jgi:hypothetical protein
MNHPPIWIDKEVGRKAIPWPLANNRGWRATGVRHASAWSILDLARVRRDRVGRSGGRHRPCVSDRRGDLTVTSFRVQQFREPLNVRLAQPIIAFARWHAPVPPDDAGHLGGMAPAVRPGPSSSRKRHRLRCSAILIERGFVLRAGNTLQRPNGLLEKYLDERPSEGRALARLFGSTENYRKHFKSVLERRIAQIDGLDVAPSDI